MANDFQQQLAAAFTALGIAPPAEKKNGITVHSPLTGQVMARPAADTAASLKNKIRAAHRAQALWQNVPFTERQRLLKAWAEVLEKQQEPLARILHLEAGKTMREAIGEVTAASSVLLKTIKDATLPEMNNMLRRKERTAAGVVGLITSFNFPMIVPFWTLAPALLAGNSVVWKPSEKTPLIALACKGVFDALFPYRDALQIAIGGVDAGKTLVAHERVDVISATGSVGMGRAIKATIGKKKNNALPPILELGGNNGVIISDNVTPAHLEFAIASLMGSFLGTTGQRCTNTRRLIVHKDMHDRVVTLLSAQIEKFLASAVSADGIAPDNEYGYSALIDEDAFRRFEQAKMQATAEGGRVLFGKRLLEGKVPNAYFVEPALALMPAQRSKKFAARSIMFQETFAPILFVVKYDGDIEQAIDILNAPDNAGLVNGIYTQSQREADRFALLNEAGHGVINSPKGTGTPAMGMGFGGNKESGTGEILNSADPLQPFTRPDRISRIAQNKDIAMGD